MKNLLKAFAGSCCKHVYPILFALIILISFSVMIFNFDPHIKIKGEAKHYALSTLTLLNKGSISFNKSDVNQGKQILSPFTDTFPKYTYNPKTFIHKWATTPAADRDYVGRSYYWGTYSALCIPAFWLFRTFHISSSNLYNAFKVTNILMILIPLFAIVFCLKAHNQLKLCMLLAFALPPVQQYINWSSAESCIYMFTVLSLIFFFNRQYFRSAIMLAFAATLNYTLAPLALVIFAAMIVDNVKQLSAGESSPQKIWLTLLKKTFLFGCCFIPVYHAAIMTYLQFSSIATMTSMTDFEYLFQRFLAYLFDPNLSFLTYYNLFFLLFLGLTVWYIIKREYILLGLNVAFFLTVLGFSLIQHINCGMEGISRYGSWSGALIAFSVVAGFAKTVKSPKVCLILALAFFAISACLAFFPLGESYVKWNKISQFIFEHYPKVYKPLYSTFISRTVHADNGLYAGPVFLDAGTNKIIMIRKDGLKYFWTSYSAKTPEAKKALDKQIRKFLSALPHAPEYVYLYTKVNDISTRSDKFHIAIAQDRKFFVLRSGFARIDPWGVWTIGGMAAADFKIPNHLRNRNIVLGVLAFSHGKEGTPQAVTLKSQGQILSTLRFASHGKYKIFQMTIPQKLTSKEYLPLEFHISNPISPRELGKNMDQRRLGIGLVKIEMHLESISEKSFPK